MIRIYLALAAVICALSLGAWARHLAHDRDAWQARAAAWRTYGLAERAAFRESERRRGLEQRRAVVAVDETAQACRQRIARARASSAAISALIAKEPRHAENGCPVRALLDPGELRHALDLSG